jgi:hypothetical protein
VNTGDFETFLELAQVLAKEGWVIAEFKDLGGAVTLTILPQGKETNEKEKG